MKYISTVLLVIIVTLISACSLTEGFVSVEKKFSGYESHSGYHRVVRGETLYSIAWRYGLDYRAVASANSIPSPYTIYPGQRIALGGASGSVASSQQKRVNNTSKSSSGGQTTPSAPVTSVPPVITLPPKQEIAGWQWPANGRLIAKYSTTPPLNKGIDIDGALGESVMAAMAGTVVYAGQGLRGYGNLVIIKHNDTYLSAYAHANKIIVSEQDTVKAGQKIAEIGSTGTDRNKLHFEIRQNGQPVDPLNYLPTK